MSKLKSHEQYVIDLANVRQDVVVTEPYINSATPTMHKFLNCGHEYPVRPNSVLSGQGCGVCCGAVVIPGINSLDITHPWLAEYFVNKDDMRHISYGSSKKVSLKCPICGKPRSMSISQLVSQGFSCSLCGDGVGIPEKFMGCVLTQLHIDFIHRKVFDWSKNIWTPLENKYANKEYDFYIAINNTIIETHGRQHYVRCTYEKLGGRTLEQEQDNDRIKKSIAEQNGMRVITIDCRYSSMSFMKNSILHSDLMKIYDLSMINWEVAYATAIKSLVNEVVYLWESGLSVKDIIRQSRLGESTVTKYLKDAANAGLCSYTKEESWQRGNKAKSGTNCYRYGDHSYARGGNPQALKTVLLNRNNEPVLMWDCTKDIEDELRINSTGVSQCCNGIQGYEYVDNLKFRYLKDIFCGDDIDTSMLDKNNFSFDQIKSIVEKCKVYKNCVIRFDKNFNVLDAWESPLYASSQLNGTIKISKSAISKCCLKHKKHKTAGGFDWAYLYDHYKKNGECVPGALSHGLVSEDFIYSIIKIDI